MRQNHPMGDFKVRVGNNQVIRDRGVEKINRSCVKFMIAKTPPMSHKHTHLHINATSNPNVKMTNRNKRMHLYKRLENHDHLKIPNLLHC